MAIKATKMLRGIPLTFIRHNISLDIIKLFLIFLISIPSPVVLINGYTFDRSEDLYINKPVETEIRNLYLFQYQSTEKKSLEQFFKQNTYSSFKFFENVHVGMVSITDTELSKLKTTFNYISSRLQTSELRSVLPSPDDLILKNFKHTQQAYELPRTTINASTVVSSGHDGSGVSIAILDSGLDTTHPDFTNIGYQESFISQDYGYPSEEGTLDLHGHGTHVAGIAAGGGPFPGVATGAELVNLKVADMFGSASVAAVIAALDRAVEQNVDVVSISLGFGLSDPWGSEDILAHAVNKVVEQGIPVVAAAGNEADASIPFMTINTPASAKQVISVGATNGSQHVIHFSSQGPTYDFRPDPDIVAPGYQIIGPLASGGVIDLAYNALVDVSISDYIILSGTSMAAPVVSGAIALLLDQFPDASPYALRAALQESAQSLGENESLYSQGSGLVNVGLASELLETSHFSSEYGIISTIPRTNDIDFFQPVSFPGDHTEISLPFVTGSSGSVTWEISDNLIPFVTFNLTPNTFSSPTYFEKVLSVDIPYNTSPGPYRGNVSYSFGDQDFFLPISFDVKLPNEKIYWDSYHTNVDDSYFINYHELNQFIQGPDYRYDIIDYNSPILETNLSQNGILVLTDLEKPLSSREIENIKSFHENGGSILLVTSFVPYFNLDPYERIVDTLNLPIDFSNKIELVNYVDNGRERTPVTFTRSKESLSISSSNPFLNGVEDLPRLGGTAFYGNLTDPSLTHYAQLNDYYLVVAGLEKENKGKVLLLGSEEWLSPSYLQSSSGKTFVTNILDWLSSDQPPINVQYDPYSSTLEIAIYPDSLQNFFLSLELINGTKIHDIPIPYNTTLTFAYLKYDLFDLEGSKLVINIVGEIIDNLNTTFDVQLPTIGTPIIEDILVKSLSEFEIEKPSWWDESNLLVKEGLNITVDHSLAANITAQVIISSQYQKSLDKILPPLTSDYYVMSYVWEINLNDVSTEKKSILWMSPESLLTGYYAYEVQVWWENDQSSFLLNFTRDTFFVPDTEPVFNTEQSLIGDLSLNEHRDILTFQDIPNWSPGEEIDINLSILDEESDTFEVYYQLLHYYLFAADRVVLDTYVLPPSPSNSHIHTGIFTIPDQPIPLPDEEDLEVKIEGEYFILLFFVRDAQGNSILEAIFFQITTDSLFDIPIVIIAVVFAFAITVLIIYLIKRNERKRYDRYSYRIEKSQDFAPPPQVPAAKYCIQCGTPIPIEAKFCSNCGGISDFRE